MAGKKKLKNNISSNASASAFGWDFQTNAAILLMLENIERAKSVKVEAQTEDIEIKLENNNIIYSQAKSLEDITSTSNLLNKLKDSIRTLNNANNNGNAECLIYITNHSNPFNDTTSIQYFLGRSKLSYNELPQKCKNKIIKIISDNNYSIDTSKLKIYVLPFYGNDRTNREKALKEAIEEFLEKLDVRTNFTPQKMLEIWQRDFFHNATIPDSTIQVTKNSMIWTLIAEVCQFDRSDKYLEVCDDGMIEEIEHKYRTIIDNKIEEFEFTNRVLNDYINYQPNQTYKIRTQNFINEQYGNYLEDFNVGNIDEDSRLCLIKIILNKIISNRYIIDKIKRGANICD